MPWYRHPIARFLLGPFYWSLVLIGDAVFVYILIDTWPWWTP